MSQFKGRILLRCMPPLSTSLTFTPFPLTEHLIRIRVDACELNPVDIQLINFPIWYVPGLRHEEVMGEGVAGHRRWSEWD
jgi:hypothetical protein